MLFIPSINSLFVTGILLLFIIIIIANNFNSLVRLDYYRKINILLLLVIAFGIHGLIHLGVETNYGFNPYTWFK